MRLPLAIVACAVLLGACADKNSATSRTGNTDTLRIVSLAPHLTELIYTAGAGDYLVGVVAYSDYPQEALLLPVIGDAFRIDPERLAAVEPNLILAWQGGNPDAVIDQLIARGYKVVRLSSARLIDVANNLKKIGELTNKTKIADYQADEVLATIGRLAKVYAHASTLSVFYQISPQPLYTVGANHPISEMIGLCGGKNLFDDLQQAAPIVSLEDVLSRNPDVIITGDDNAQFEQWSRWSDLSAVANNNLFVVNASLVTRPSIRMLQGAEQICAHLERARARL